MMHKRLQNRIAGSKLALPLTLAYTLGVCAAAGFAGRGWWVQTGCLLAAVLLMAYMNNANALLRVYSRMVSCSFAVISLTAVFLLPSIKDAVVGLCAIGFYIIIFRTYQDRRSSGTVFYAFMLLGIASVFFIQTLFFVPVLWVLMGTNLLSLSWRNVLASLLGVVFPYWFLGGYCLYADKLDAFIAHFVSMADFSWFLDYSAVTMQEAVSFGFIALLGLIGAVHFLRQSYNDKIRTRMLFELFIAMEVVVAAFVCLAPKFFDPLLRLLIVNVAPLAAHFFTLTHTRITNLAFVLLSLAAVSITACNILGIWSFSLTF